MNTQNETPDSYHEFLEHLIRILDKMGEEIRAVLVELGDDADPQQEQPEQFEIQHVGYDADQLGRNK